MRTLLKLIKWELYKLLVQKKTWIGLLAILGFSMLIAFSFNMMSNLDDFQGMSEFHPLTFGVFMIQDMLGLILPIFLIIALTSMLTTDYIDGTMKMLLIRPFTRAKIFFAKYITAYIYVLLFLTFSYVIGVGAGFIFFDSSAPLIGGAILGETFDITTGTYVLRSIGYVLFNSLVFISLIGFVSLFATLIDSAAAVNGFVIVFILFSGILTQIPIDFLEYIYNSTFLTLGTTIFWSDYTLAWADVKLPLILAAAYTVIFTSLAYFRFKKRDILL